MEFGGLGWPLSCQLAPILPAIGPSLQEPCPSAPPSTRPSSVAACKASEPAARLARRASELRRSKILGELCAPWLQFFYSLIAISKLGPFQVATQPCKTKRARAHAKSIHILGPMPCMIVSGVFWGPFAIKSGVRNVSNAQGTEARNKTNFLNFIITGTGS